MEQDKVEADRASVFKSISDLLEWLAKIWAPLGAFVVATAAIYWLEFIRIYAIPVSFASSSVLTGLPAIAATIAAMVSILSIFVLMPAALLFIPADSAGKTLMDGHRNWRTKHSSTSRGTRGFSRWGLLERWIAAQVGLVLLWAVVIGTWVLDKDISVWASTVVALAITVIGYWYLLGSFRKRVCGKPTLDFRMMFVALTGMQFLVTLSAIDVALHTTPDPTLPALALRGALCFVGLTILGFAQLVVAKLVSKGWYPNAPKHIVLALLILSALPTALPPVGGAMVAFALHTSANDGKSCVVLLASDTANPKIWHEVLDTNKSDQSMPLDFAVRLDDSYYVKQTKTSSTHPIPVSQTRGVGSCPSNPPSPQQQKAPPPKPATDTQTAHPSTWDTPSLLISAASMLVAIGSLLFSIQSWRQTNRPLVVARIATHSGGNMGIALNLVIENTGNRPALDVQLHANESHVRQALVDASPNADIPTDATRVFFSDVFVPVLVGGKTVSNAFGSLGTDGVWQAGATIPITISYRGLGGPRYRESMTLLLADDEGFAQTFWS